MKTNVWETHVHGQGPFTFFDIIHEKLDIAEHEGRIISAKLYYYLEPGFETFEKIKLEYNVVTKTVNMGQFKFDVDMIIYWISKAEHKLKCAIISNLDLKHLRRSN